MNTKLNKLLSLLGKDSKKTLSKDKVNVSIELMRIKDIVLYSKVESDFKELQQQIKQFKRNIPIELLISFYKEIFKTSNVEKALDVLIQKQKEKL